MTLRLATKLVLGYFLKLKRQIVADRKSSVLFFLLLARGIVGFVVSWDLK